MIPKVPASLNAKLTKCLTDFLPKTTTDVSVKDIQVHESKGYSSLIYTFSGEFSLEGRKSSKEFMMKEYRREFVDKGRKEFSLFKVLKKQNLPVPTAYCFEEENPITGKPIMIMDRIRGKTGSNYLNDEKDAKFIVENMAKILVKVHAATLNKFANSSTLIQEYIIKQAPLMETRFIISKPGMKFFVFSPRTQRRFIAAVKKLGVMEPKKVPQTLLHVDYILDHILISNGQCIVIDWGDAIIGDPAYDIARTYHMLRLEQNNTKVDMGEYFVKCYKKYGNQNSLVNLQFFKDNTAIEIGKSSGLSYFNAHRFRNYAKLVSLIFGDVVGEFNREKYVKRQQKNYAQHHNAALRNVRRLQSYALQYLERDRYEIASTQ